VVNEDKFKSVLVLLNLYFTEEDVSYLLAKYRLEKDQINYLQFCSEVEQVFDEERTQETSSLDPEVARVLEAFRSVVATRRILLKSPFQDFDRTKSSHITADQFSRVLQSLDILPSPSAFKKLLDHFSQNGREVNYLRFCQQVDTFHEYNRMTTVGVKPESTYTPPTDSQSLNLLTNRFIQAKQKPQTDAEAVEQKIQAIVVMKQLRINFFFQDYDNLRKGTVTETQFHRVLKQTNIHLSPAEVSTLTLKYKLPNGLVQYTDFCAAIDRVFTEKAIDKDPLFKVPQIDRATTLPAKREFLPFTADEELAFQKLVAEYRTEISRKRVLMKPYFMDFDKTKKGYITKNQFLRILNQFSLYPDETSLNLLLKAYIDNGNLDEVNYFHFCNDVDIYHEGVAIS